MGSPEDQKEELLKKIDTLKKEDQLFYSTWALSTLFVYPGLIMLFIAIIKPDMRIWGISCRSLAFPAFIIGVGLHFVIGWLALRRFQKKTASE